MGGIERRISFRRARHRVGDDRSGEQPETADGDGAKRDPEARPPHGAYQSDEAEQKRTGGRQ